jgi:hypothetical protein
VLEVDAVLILMIIQDAQFFQNIPHTNIRTSSSLIAATCKASQDIPYSSVNGM